MPHPRHSGLRGNLYVKFQVDFPDKFEADNEFFQVRNSSIQYLRKLKNEFVFLFKKLESLLPPKPSNPLGISEDAEEVDLHDFSNTRGAGDFDGTGSGNAYDEDDPHGHHHGHGGGVSCQQQ